MYSSIYVGFVRSCYMWNSVSADATVSDASETGPTRLLTTTTDV